jgi:hypothetical protein
MARAASDDYASVARHAVPLEDLQKRLRSAETDLEKATTDTERIAAGWDKQRIEEQIAASCRPQPLTPAEIAARCSAGAAAPADVRAAAQSSAAAVVAERAPGKRSRGQAIEAAQQAAEAHGLTGKAALNVATLAACEAGGAETAAPKALASSKTPQKGRNIQFCERSMVKQAAQAFKERNSS